MLPLVPAIWEKTGLPFGLLLGVLVGGSLFGDNLSFISDTTIIATRSLNIGNKEKFIENIWLVVPAYIITIIAMAFYNVGAIGDLGTVPLTFTSILTMLPYLLVIVLALLGMNVFFVLVIGTIASIAIAVGTGTFGFIESLNVFYNGIPERYIGGLKGMEDVSMWALFVGGTIGLMKNLGGLDFLVYHITKSIKSKKGAEFACVAVTAACSFCITNNTLTSLTAAPICREISDKYKLAPRRVASIVDIFASVVCGLVPYGGFCLMTAGFTMGAVSAIQITPYVWYCWAMGVVALIAVATGYPHFGKKAKAKA
jgi:Na+/H+ antiporter NhaC